jgi:hypothetical protein
VVSSGLIKVGATLLFFGTAGSSFSDSLVSLLPSTLPLTELGRLLINPDIGVCGGVVQDKPLKDGFVAATLGTLPKVGVGLLLIICDDCVAIDDVELDLLGLGGGSGAGEGASTGVHCLSKVGGADAAVGVGTGVGCDEDPVETGAGDGWWALGTWPVNICPSSPGLKVRVEQKPSDELMSNVSPSLDLEILSARFDHTFSRFVPGKVCESCKVQVAHDSDGSHLLRVVYKHRVLRRHSIDDAVRQSESWSGSGCRSTQIVLQGSWR